MERLPIEITENGIYYTLQGGYYFPDLVGPGENRPIGKWGRMHLNCLKEHKPGLVHATDPVRQAESLPG